MPRPAARHAALGAVALLVAAACSVLAPADPRLCAAAQNLTAAMALTATAVAADERGELAQAQGLATQARTLTELAHGTLQQLSDEDRSKDAPQRLLEVYLHTAQAANSLLPAYVNTHGIGAGELATAGASLAKAKERLPPMCFDVPNDVETPGPTGT